jgi:hypothetical protein
MKDKELAKRLIDEAVEKYALQWEGVLDAKSKKKLKKDWYSAFLAGLTTLEEIRAEFMS